MRQPLRVPPRPIPRLRPRVPMVSTFGLVSSPALLIYLLLAWLAGRWLGLHGTDLWILRAALMFLGLVAYGLVRWFYRGARAAKPAEPPDDELDATLAAARARLASARVAGTGALGRLPMVVFVGLEDSAKTSVVVHCGLEPDLLAGGVFHGEQIVPTGSVNVWYTQRTVLVEAGGALAAERDRWSRLVRLLRPEALGAALSGRAQAPRVAVVCLSCEQLLKADAAASAPAAARELRELIVEMARGFGTQLPVYVLFTKADRIPYFAEFVRNLSREEAQEVLGATLRWPARGTVGATLDKEYERVGEAFQRLLTSLAEKRLILLPRDLNPQRRAATYEFPRELRKISALASQCLVELCRPSQLHVSPILRGFYFCGARAVIVSDAASAAAPQVAPGIGAGSMGATQVFDASRHAPRVEHGQDVTASSRKVPQWAFLERLFRDVLLRDRLAMGITASGGRLRVWRRVALSSAAALCLLLASCFTVSFVGNKRLERRALSAARGLSAVRSAEPELPTHATLRRLEELRAEIGVLHSHDVDGPPLRLRWGLYVGSDLYPLVRRMYMERFESLMLGPARQSILDSLSSSIGRSEATVDYERSYELLKAYLMTTTETARVDSAFLAPILWNRWLRGRAIDEEREELARRQLDLFAAGLCRARDNPCAVDADARIVLRARNFLGGFTQTDRYYQLLLSEAGRTNPPLRFSERFPNARGTVADDYAIPGAFTPSGWEFVQRRFRNVDMLFAAEDWVVGEQATLDQDPYVLADQLRARYLADYIAHWNSFLATARVQDFTGPRDASSKLESLSGSQSPLLQLLHLTAQATAVDAEAVTPAFQPVHLVTPTTLTDRYIGEANQAYMDALLGLQTSMATVANTPVNERDGPIADTRLRAAEARRAVGQLTQQFSIEPAASTASTAVKRLLEEPITKVEQMLGAIPRSDINQRGAEFCAAFEPLMRKFPFNPAATTEASLDEVASIFQPESGRLWIFFNESLQGVLVQQAPYRFAPRPGASLRALDSFVDFLSRAAQVSYALWPSGATDPSFQFTLKPRLSEQVPAVTFNIDGQPGTFSRTVTPRRVFRWLGPEAREVKLSAQLGGREEDLRHYFGTWAVFKLFQEGTWRTSGTLHVVQWSLPFQDQTVMLEAEVDLGETPPILDRNYFRGIRSCVSRIVR